MIVVADTSPLNYLILIECHHLLPLLYGRIAVPPAVLQELGHAGTPQDVRKWVDSLPDWIDVIGLETPPDAGLALLDLGEREAIQMAEEQNATLLLIDDRKGRAEAHRRNLHTIGTLGVLLTAGEQNLIDPEPIYCRLIRETTFRTSPALERKIFG